VDSGERVVSGLLELPGGLGPDRHRGRPPGGARALLGVLLTALSLGCGAEANEGELADARRCVVVASVGGGALADERVYLGEVRAQHRLVLAFGVSGRVSSLEWREGERVEAGELLATLDRRQAHARLSAASSRVSEQGLAQSQARRELARAEALGASVVSAESLEQARGRLDAIEAAQAQARAQRRGARSGVAEHTLIAPFAGVVEARVSEVGAWVEAGEGIVELLGDDALEIRVAVAPELRAALKVGDRFELRPLQTPRGALAPSSFLSPSRARGQPPLMAELTSIASALEPRTQTLELRLRPDGSPASGPASESASGSGLALLAGASVYVAFTFEHPLRSEAVLVPRDALVVGADGPHVVAVVDGRAQLYPVEVLASAGRRVQVRTPELEPGDAVVVRGNERVAQGQALRIVGGP